MSSLWEQFRENFFPQQPKPHTHENMPWIEDALALNREMRMQAKTANQSRHGYPNTFNALADQGRPEIFEPSLLHFGRAFRAGEPAFPDLQTRQQWYAARRLVIDHLLRLIHQSRWSDHLVLRGSLLLKAWLSEAAREPGDIDWVFQPKEVTIHNALAHDLFAELFLMVREQPVVGEIVINTEQIATDDIWTYERADGRRIVFPWKAPSLPAGSVQMDVVFAEELWQEPIRVELPLADGTALDFWAASKELSLVWKLLWLSTDSYPQGKDLYDAVLLAEQAVLLLPLFARALEEGDGGNSEEFTPHTIQNWCSEWEDFQKEYPWVEGSEAEWKSRLISALAPSFGSQWV